MASDLRRDKRVDSNQREIVDALRAVGATVEIIGRPLDLLVGYRGFNYLIECKTADGTLNSYQCTFVSLWRGQWCVVRSVDQALKQIGAIEARG